MENLIQNISENPLLSVGFIFILTFLVPLFIKKIRIPSIVGLIIAGIIVGPNGFGIIRSTKIISIFGNIGILYLMFIAGLDLDILSFKRSKLQTVTYGLLLFALPFSISFFVFKFAFGYSLMAALMVSLIFPTNTPVSYPITKRLEISGRKPAIIAVAAAAILDSVNLFFLGIFKSMAGSSGFTLSILAFILLKFALYALIILFFVPFSARKLLSRSSLDGEQQFVFVFSLLFFTVFLSSIFDIEPIIGAFLCGLALNRFIPASSPLMNRTEFVGNTIFIPFFLIYVGFLINVKSLVSGSYTWLLAGIFILISFIGKYLAVFSASILFKINSNERKLIYGLNLSHAGATIAVSLVVFRLGLTDSATLNAVIILILFSCIISSFVTEFYGRKCVMTPENSSSGDLITPRKILIPFSNPDNFPNLINLANILSNDRRQPLYPLYVVKDSDSSASTIISGHKLMHSAVEKSLSAGILLSPQTRIDTSFPDAVSRASEELMTNCIVIGKSPHPERKRLVPVNLLLHSASMLIIPGFSSVNSKFKAAKILLPENFEFEQNANSALDAAFSISTRMAPAIEIFCRESANLRLSSYIKRKYSEMKIAIKIYEDNSSLSKVITGDDQSSIILPILPRLKTVSYSTEYISKISRSIAENDNFVVIYPEASNSETENTLIGSEVLDTSVIDEPLGLMRKLGRRIREIMK